MSLTERIGSLRKELPKIHPSKRKGFVDSFHASLVYGRMFELDRKDLRKAARFEADFGFKEHANKLLNHPKYHAGRELYLELENLINRWNLEEEVRFDWTAVKELLTKAENMDEATPYAVSALQKAFSDKKKLITGDDIRDVEIVDGINFKIRKKGPLNKLVYQIRRINTIGTELSFAPYSRRFLDAQEAYREGRLPRTATLGDMMITNPPRVQLTIPLKSYPMESEERAVLESLVRYIQKRAEDEEMGEELRIVARPGMENAMARYLIEPKDTDEPYYRIRFEFDGERSLVRIVRDRHCPHPMHYLEGFKREMQNRAA